MFELKKIVKTFGDVHVLAHIDLSVPDGQTTMLIGPSGCGKCPYLSADRKVEP